VISPSEVSSQNTSLCLTEGFIRKPISSLSKTSKFQVLTVLTRRNSSMKIVKIRTATFQDRKVRSPTSTSNHSFSLLKTRSDIISNSLTQLLCSLSTRRHLRLYLTGSKIRAILALRQSKRQKNSSQFLEIRLAMWIRSRSKAINSKQPMAKSIITLTIKTWL